MLSVGIVSLTKKIGYFQPKQQPKQQTKQKPQYALDTWNAFFSFAKVELGDNNNTIYTIFKDDESVAKASCHLKIN